MRALRPLTTGRPAATASAAGAPSVTWRATRRRRQRLKCSSLSWIGLQWNTGNYALAMHHRLIIAFNKNHGGIRFSLLTLQFKKKLTVSQLKCNSCAVVVPSWFFHGFFFKKWDRGEFFKPLQFVTSVKSIHQFPNLEHFFRKCDLRFTANLIQWLGNTSFSVLSKIVTIFHWKTWPQFDFKIAQNHIVENLNRKSPNYAMAKNNSIYVLYD